MTLIFLKHQAIIWYWEQHVYDSEIKGAAPGTFKGGRGSFIALTSRGNSHPRSDVLQSDLRDAVKESCLTERAVCSPSLSPWSGPPLVDFTDYPKRKRQLFHVSYVPCQRVTEPRVTKWSLYRCHLLDCTGMLPK